MNNLNTYLIEKLKLNKDMEDFDYIHFCEELEIESNNTYSKKLYNEFQSNCNNILKDALGDIYMPAGLFFPLLMLSVMLLDDQHTLDSITLLGYKDYRGKNNPYNYDWFEEENEDGKDVLNIIQDEYQHNTEFNKYFKDFFKIVKHVWSDSELTPKIVYYCEL